MDNYTLDEWREIAPTVSFDEVPTHQVALLHVRWIWANHSRWAFGDALDDWTDLEDFTARAPWAMYVWYGLFYAVIEGLTERKVRLGGRLAVDLRTIREPLRDARNATFHVGDSDGYWDMRLFDMAKNRDFAHQVTRAHEAIGQLLLHELRRRNDAAEADSSSGPTSHD